jgi:hypothetical protein
MTIKDRFSYINDSSYLNKVGEYFSQLALQANGISPAVSVLTIGRGAVAVVHPSITLRADGMHDSIDANVLLLPGMQENNSLLQFIVTAERKGVDTYTPPLKYGNDLSIKHANEEVGSIYSQLASFPGLINLTTSPRYPTDSSITSSMKEDLKSSLFWENQQNFYFYYDENFSERVALVVRIPHPLPETIPVVQSLVELTAHLYVSRQAHETMRDSQ